jgi:hypothetical protein
MERDVQDCGTVLWRIQDINTDSISFVGEHNFNECWTLATPHSHEYGNATRHHQDATFVADVFPRAHLIAHLVLLYTQLQEQDIEHYMSDDACDTHSQTLITSDEEEEI